MSNKKKNTKHGEESKTKKYKVQKVAKNKEEIEGKTKGKKKKSKKGKIIKRIILILLALFIIAGIVGAGIVIGIFSSDKYKVTREELEIGKSNSTVVDGEGNTIATLSYDENRKIITLDDMTEYLPKAFIAIEDKRFEEHHGIDLFRTATATIKYVFKGSSSYGGSTITQQLIKNTFEDKEDSATRKIREMARAYNVENVLSKTEILELYLNRIYLGGYSQGENVTGVEIASNYYFNKSAKDLTIAESAFLAGINNTPNSYDPFDAEKDHTDLIKKRCKTVIAEMKDQQMLNEEQYNGAIVEIDNGLKFDKGAISMRNGNVYSYHTAAAIDQIVQEFKAKYDLTAEAARQKLFGGGYTIYTTQNTTIQNRMEEEYKKDKYIYKGRDKDKDGNLKNAHSQSAMVIIDHTTGQVVGTVGGLGTDVNALGVNRATQGVKFPGSSIKPIGVIAPALEKGTITAGTVYDDTRTTFGGGYNPGNSGSYRGLLSVTQAIQHSSNVISCKIMAETGPTNALEMLKKMGLSNSSKTEAVLSLALGTIDTNPLEMAGAYASIANDGVYITPTFYTKVTRADGSTELEAKQEQTRVMSADNAYILKEILESPVNGGTASGVKVSGMDTAAKTGSTDDYKDRWLCGFTPYYTAATWYGFDSTELPRWNGNLAQTIWAAVMKDIHTGLPNKSFEKTANIVSATICLDSGCAVTESCTKKATYSFVKGTVPNKCEGHQKLKICKDSGKLANEFCKNVEEQTILVKPEREQTKLWNTPENGKYGVTITETCTVHKAPEQVTVPNVIGKKSADAQKTLTDLGLKVKIVYSEDKTKDNGITLKQSIEKDKKVDKGTEVTITVNKKAETGGGNTNTEKPNNNTVVDTNTTVPSTNTTVD